MAKPQFTVTVQVQALPEQTDVAHERWAYSYTINIENSGSVAAQLVARHWKIVDAKGVTQVVSGLAVVGHQPFLKPGERFEYSSWAQIGTPQGSMSGRFLCVSDGAEVFYAEVPEFGLVAASALH